MMLDDLRDIRLTLVQALELFRTRPTGRVWYGDITGDLDPAACAWIVASLEARIAALDTWLVGPLTFDEELWVMEFVERWRAAELVIERQRGEWGMRPIPSLDVPTRKREL